MGMKSKISSSLNFSQQIIIIAYSNIEKKSSNKIAYIYYDLRAYVLPPSKMIKIVA